MSLTNCISNFLSAFLILISRFASCEDAPQGWNDFSEGFFMQRMASATYLTVLNGLSEPFYHQICQQIRYSALHQCVLTLVFIFF